VVLKSTVALEISCRQVREELTNYMEGDITPELRERVESHLAACSGCRVYYDNVRQVIRILGETEPIELPAGFSQRLYSRLMNL
jgi:predicted anti-sigma-YlaC factor YlaD